MYLSSEEIGYIFLIYLIIKQPVEDRLFLAIFDGPICTISSINLRALLGGNVSDKQRISPDILGQEY